MNDASTSERLLDAAEKRMRRGGFNAVSFRDLADDVSVKSASVHYHFPTKADLGVALVRRYHQRFFESLAARTSKARSAARKLSLFGSVYRDALYRDGSICLCGMLGAESAGLPKAVQRQVKSFFEANIVWVSRQLSGGARSRAPRNEAAAIVAGLQGALILASSLEDISVYDAAMRRLLPLRAAQAS